MDQYPKQLKALLDAARSADEPTPGDRSRIHDALNNKLAAHGFNAVGAPLPQEPVATAATGSGAGASASGARLLTFILAGGALLGGLIVLLLPWPQSDAPAPRAEVPAASSTELGPVPVAHSSVPASPEPAQLAPAQDTAPAPELQPALQPAHANSKSTARANSRDAAHPRVAREPVQVAAALAPKPALPAAQTDQPETVATVQVAPEARAAASEPNGLSEEIKLIAAARREIQNGDARAALQYLAQHAHRFEHGVLSDERQGLQVLALCTLGPSAEAITARDRFLSRAPNSVLAAQVSGACAQRVSRRDGP